MHPAVVPLIFRPGDHACFAIARSATQACSKAILRIVGGYGIIERILDPASSSASEPEHGIGARLHFLVHGVHHDHPNDPMRLVMPPAVSVPLGTFFTMLN